MPRGCKSQSSRAFSRNGRSTLAHISLPCTLLLRSVRTVGTILDACFLPSETTAHSFLVQDAPPSVAQNDSSHFAPPLGAYVSYCLFVLFIDYKNCLSCVHSGSRWPVIRSTSTKCRPWGQIILDNQLFTHLLVRKTCYTRKVCCTTMITWQPRSAEHSCSSTVHRLLVSFLCAKKIQVLIMLVIYCEWSPRFAPGGYKTHDGSLCVYEIIQVSPAATSSI